MKKFTRIGLIILLAFLIQWGFSLVRCEVLTAKYGEPALYSAGIEQTMIEGDSAFKVLEYKPAGYARLYARGDNSGSELILVRDWSDEASQPWKVVFWNTIWSRQGSADGFIWPYFR
ncbi:MAG: hypothetical protein Q4E13_11335 [Clostridia bacterium]|nr:hypothetical protein [Clostridia bacterium]